MEEFNKEFGRKIVWLPWQRPGFELALMLEKADADNPGAEGIILGSHGLFTWGHTQRECYVNSIETIDQMGQLHRRAREAKGRRLRWHRQAPRSPTARPSPPRFCPPSAASPPPTAARSPTTPTMKTPSTFAGSNWAKELCGLGTCCPDHFLRTRISPMFVDWNPATESVDVLKTRIAEEAVAYRESYAEYYNAWARPDSPKLRDSNPSVIVIPGLGLFGFGKNKKEARITTEFFINAIHVMAGRSGAGR